MSKRWTLEEDDFLARHFDSVGDYVGTHDLGRPSGAAAKRVAKLIRCGTWGILKRRLEDDYRNLRAYYISLRDRRSLDDIDMLHPAAPPDRAGMVELVQEFHRLKVLEDGKAKS